jgi:general secretion pathway protein B
MSYILDSLKKSEQKRKQLEQPGLYSEPLGSLARPSSGRRVWPYLLVAALLLNAGLLGWYLLGQGESDNQATDIVPVRQTVMPVHQPAAPQVAQSPDTVTATPAGELTPLAPPAGSERLQDIEEPLPAPPAVGSVTASAVRTGNLVTAPEPIPVSQLPADLQQQLPPLILSLHYFAGPEANSLIRLDGVILRTGEQLQKGLSVREIVADGVILDFHGRLIWLARPQG